MLEGLIDLMRVAATHPATIILAIILATFVLEDAATIGAALLAAEGTIPVSAAMLGLFLGITIGDLGLYGIGNLARRWNWLANRIGEARLARGEAWLSGRILPSILLARITPGLRLTCYTASGYLGVSFKIFAAIAVIAVAIWSVATFTLVFQFGQIAQAWLGKFSWIAGGILLALVIAWPYLFRRRSTS